MTDDNVVDLDAQRPHLTVEGESRVHVVPVALIEDVIIGKRSPTVLGDELTRDILAQWLRGVQDE